MKRRTANFLFAMLFVFLWSQAVRADFFVIAGKKAKKTVLVSPKGTAAESGTTLLSALDRITDNSESNSYLVIIEPGVFDLGTDVLQMKPYVDIQGAGQEVTKITGTVSGLYSGVVMGADHAELRSLTVENTGGDSYAIAICNDHVSPRITNVTAVGSGGTSINRGIYNYYSPSVMTNVTASASGGSSSYGIYNHWSSIVMTNVSAEAAGASTTRAVYNYRESTSVMTNVTAAASDGGSVTTGVYNSNCTPTMMNVTATATGTSGDCNGVRNHVTEVDMIHVTASSSGCTNNRGLYNDSSTSTVRVYNSRLSSPTGEDDYSVRNLTDSSCYIGASQLEGGPAINTGSLRCVDSYNSLFIGIGADCIGP